MTKAGGEEGDGAGRIALSASSAKGNTSAETFSVNTLDILNTSIYLDNCNVYHNISNEIRLVLSF